MGQDEERIGPLVRQWSERSQAAGVTDFVRGKIREMEAEFGIKERSKRSRSATFCATSSAPTSSSPAKPRRKHTSRGTDPLIRQQDIGPR
eukprot:3624645-Rhodomonas_salina.6